MIDCASMHPPAMDFHRSPGRLDAGPDAALRAAEANFDDYGILGVVKHLRMQIKSGNADLKAANETLHRLRSLSSYTERGYLIAWMRERYDR
jgi:hypothetical protein